MPFEFNARESVEQNKKVTEKLEELRQADLSLQIFEEMKNNAEAAAKLVESRSNETNCILDFESSDIYGVQRASLPEPEKFSYKKVDKRDSDGSRRYHESVKLPGYSYREHNQINADGSESFSEEEHRGPLDYTKMSYKGNADGSSELEFSDSSQMGLVRSEIHEREMQDGSSYYCNDSQLFGLRTRETKTVNEDGSKSSSLYNGIGFGAISRKEARSESGDSRGYSQNDKFFGNRVVYRETANSDGSTTKSTSFTDASGLISWSTSQEQ